MESWAQSWLNYCDIHGGHSGTGAGLSVSFSCSSPWRIIPSFLHAYLPWLREMCDIPDQQHIIPSTVFNIALNCSHSKEVNPFKL
jgi:hypothetical protein